MSAQATYHPGALIASRYQLIRLIGRGTFGQVHVARDVFTQAEVAIKLLSRPAALSDLWREAALLRQLQHPNIAPLRDEGVHQGAAFLVLDLIEGEHFPGVALPASWEQLAPRWHALLSLVARLHAAQIIHCDLKPANILVGAGGALTLLDFGLAQQRHPSIEEQAMIAGSPAYIAPELWRGAGATARSDLWALGVMLFECLTGRRPFEARSRSALLRNILLEELPPIPGCPPEVQALVDALLAKDPAQRPASAAACLAMLGVAAPQTSYALPLLGREETLKRLAATLAAGQRARLTGPRGVGRTRLLQQLAATLETPRPARLLEPAARPWGSSLPLLDAPPDAQVSGIALREQLLSALREHVLLIDQLDALDQWTRALIEAHAETLSYVVGVGSLPGVEVALEPLGEEAIAALFEGREALLHLPSRAARCLWDRTGGIPAHLHHELTRLLDAELIQQEGGRLVITSGAMTRIEQEAPLLHQPREHGALSEEEERLLGWVHHIQPLERLERLGELCEQPGWALDALVESLCQRGLLHQDSRGAWRTAWTPQRATLNATAHEQMAALLPASHPHRLRHLLRAAAPGPISEAALALARHLDQLGRPEPAIAALEEATRAVIALDARALAGPLLRAWAGLALSLNTPDQLERLLVQLQHSPHDHALTQLVLTARLALRTRSEEALATLDACAPLEDTTLELRRQTLRVRLRWGQPAERLEALLLSLEPWARGHDEPDTWPTFVGWMGLLRYRQRRFGEAIALHIEAMQQKQRPTARLSSMLNAASAALEAGQLDLTLRLAGAAASSAAALPHPVYEARARYLARAASYRARRAPEPEPALLEAVEALGVQELVGLCALLDAAICWRGGDLEGAHRLAARAQRAWLGTHNRSAGLLAAALMRRAAGDAEGLIEEACALEDPGLRLQALALLSEGDEASTRAALTALHALRDAEATEQRMELLSIAECVERLSLDQAPKALAPPGYDRCSHRRGRRRGA